MTEVTLYITGDKIASYATASSQGNANNNSGDDLKVTVTGVKALGTASDYFKVVVTQVNGNYFANGQWVTIYDSSGNTVASQLNPQDDVFSGRASSSTYEFLFGGSSGYLIDLSGITDGTMTYGPIFPERTETKLPFSAMSSTEPSVDDAGDVPCFTPGTLIRTPEGLRLIEDLNIGDMVMTRDHGAQPIVWCGRTERIGIGRNAPIMIMAGALGNNRDMLVSQQHRMLVEGFQAECLFGEDEVLASAIHLVNGTTIRIDPRPSVSYLHIACERHEIIEADGAATETMFFGDSILAQMNGELRAELEGLFPELTDMHLAPARRCLRAYESKLIA
ncbi:Hint domain-containing protein [Thioclava sp. GXIMD2076]|uniref:Hint domain-containing protein n=1 Tax=Thioclava sp. GXIMD2076 TaxID=3131931 RepID=UPI0030D01759